MFSKEANYPLLCLLLQCLLVFTLLIHPGMLNSSSAQPSSVTSDGTLPTPTTVEHVDTNYQIRDGTIRGSNQFHSFGRFGLLTGESATFTGPVAIENIIGRVTGGELSSIDGLVSSTIDGANLFLVNPVGILFGPNARLDVKGSFHASTADYMKLGDEGLFYADPSGATVLAVAPPTAFGFLDPPAPIEVQGSLLEVASGATLALVGGNLSIEGVSHPESADHPESTLVAAGGELRLASVASAGEVVPDSGGEPLDVSGFDSLGQIQVLGPDFDHSALDVRGEPSGRVVIRGGNLLLETVNIAATTAGPDHPGTAVDIALTGDMRMDRSEIGASTTGLGRAGDLVIRLGGRLEMVGDPITFTNSNIGSRSFGLEEGGMMVGGGNGGSVIIEASDLVMGDTTFIQTTTFSPGKAGDITIRLSGALEMVTEDSFSFISSSSAGPIAAAMDPSIDPETFNPAGSGDAGTLSLEADRIFLREGPGASFTGLSAQVRSDAVGDPDGGALDIQAQTVEVLDGAQISGSIFHGAGNGAPMEVNADSILLQGVALNEDGSVFFTGDFFPSGIFSQVGTAAFGGTTAKGGDISVNARNLTIENGAQIRNAADFPSSGSAGNVELLVDNLTLRNSGSIFSDSFGFGDGGLISVRADHILLEGPSIAPSFSGTGLFAQGGTGARSSGEIDVQTGTLEILAGGQINTSTFGMAPGGTSLVQADEIVVSGIDTAEDNPAFPSGLKGTPSQISSDSSIFGPFVAFSGGQGGNVVIRAKDLRVEDSGIVAARTITTGSGGNLDILTETTTLHNEGEITVASSGEGNAGDINLTAGDTLLMENSSITSGAERADGGNIKINTDNLVRLVGSEITASVGGGPETVGGNINIDPEFVILEDSAIIANAFEGRGGNIRIVAGTFLADPSSIVDASSAKGIDGTVEIRAPVSDVSQKLKPSEKNFLRAAVLIREPCIARLRGGKYSSFVIEGRNGLPLEPGGLLPSPLRLD